MNTKDIGDISEAKLLAALVASGRKVFIPWGDNCRFDLLIETTRVSDTVFHRVQVKTGRLTEGSIRFRTCSVNIRTLESESYEGQIDFFGVYCPENDKSYLIPWAAIKDCKAEASLRIEPLKNGHTPPRLASTYELTNKVEKHK